MTRTNQETNYKKTTANDGGRTSPTSCRQESLFTAVTEADVELEKPGNQLQRQRQGDELVQFFFFLLPRNKLMFEEIN